MELAAINTPEVAVDIGVGGWGILIAGAGIAGWIDAMIGGGGLVLIPLIMAVAPGLAPVVAIATNKFVAVSGTASAAVTMTRKVGVDSSLVLRLVPIAALCSAGGALLAAWISKDVMRPVVIGLMVLAGIFVAFKPEFGQGGHAKSASARRRALAVLATGGIALYDGIFGPGTGMFLIMAFTALLSQDFLRSAALTKVVNTATNLGALVVFIAAGHVLWSLGIVLAVANIAGAQFGAKTVLAGGTKILRLALLTLVIVMSVYLTVQQVYGA
ncbi:hypothetical protein A4R72_00450 [Corynebacterium pseudotuberculosis]|uniref:TSUP family transporter n=1 Tax=Corynebacterium pseudotuberculosis TaxID=1719 RepID=UPI00025936C2|nr:TSUP family transporter [Corynebacterium pseudotuberculosis]AFH89933.1 TSUP family transporter [Corynebacterium pseudotuberculosis 31]APB10045.1 hypothetical protein A4R72_00450 [Corynebacterium pseudotuberculosis]APB12092.1 hypothetical protein A4R71_00455 [Corynebacterium pseudotuberculosis]